MLSSDAPSGLIGLLDIGLSPDLLFEFHLLNLAELKG
jgi:hypothetical protein